MKSTEEKEPAYLRGISAADLMEKHFAPVNYIVPGLLAEGATILAGAPKIGKSWMAYGLALSIASGRPFFGSIPVTQGDVIYLALEDSQRRLKSRLLKMGLQSAPERLTLLTEWPDLDHGCIHELEAWADAVKRPTLVIVDVLKMIRTPARGNEQIYEADYRALTGLGRFARERGLAVVIVHHTRKSSAKSGEEDPLETISGTNGLTGAADSLMVLKRDNGTPNCILYVRGRDVEESEKAVRFDGQNGTWCLLGAASEVGRTSEREAIMEVLRRHTEPMQASEIADIIGKTAPTVRKTLSRMWDNGEIKKTGRGKYTCHNSPNVPNSHEWDNETLVTGGESKEHSEWLGGPLVEIFRHEGRG